MKIAKYFFLLVILTGQTVYAQDKFKVQAMFVYNFTRMTAWPVEYQSGEFIIGVYGESPIYKELTDIAAIRQVGNQKIVVKQYHKPEEIEKCHILYVSPNYIRNLGDIFQKMKNEKIAALIITEGRNSLQNGAVINFITENERPRYEIMESNARKLGITLGQEMTRLASAAH
jgi:hypothetical protein